MALGATWKAGLNTLDTTQEDQHCSMTQHTSHPLTERAVTEDLGTTKVLLGHLQQIPAPLLNMIGFLQFS